MRGWILDLYAESPGKMVVWLKLENGETRRLVDRWMPSIFVGSDSRADLTDLEKGRGRDFSWSRFVTKYERATDASESEVLELVVDDAKKVAKLAESVELSRPFGTYRLYNVDVPPEQMYLYENDLFPLAYCDVSERREGLSWDLQDDVWSCQYVVPELRSVEVEVDIKRSGKMARFDDPVESIRLKEGGDGSTTTLSSIDGGSEQDKLVGLVEQVKKADPDLVFTSDGDAFVLPYLVARAAANGVADRLSIDRDGSVLDAPAKKGTSYFSYGKTLFKPSAVKLRGRIHLDTSNSFVCRETGMDGFYEISRVCRLPLHTASRASIGKALSSLQFNHATKGGMLIPWKPVLAESFKSRAELLVADRGGFIFEPELGVHEDVAELDFNSLYPSIMMKKNISAETVKCSCCPDSANRVPELDWNVCEKRVGVTPRTMEIVVNKRLGYKKLENAFRGEERAAAYKARRDALKWIGVTCLPRETSVFIRRDGKDRFVRIGEFVDGLVGDKTGEVECPPDMFVTGIDYNYNARYCRIARVIKQPNNQKLLSLAMEDGRKIVTTPDHPFFVLRDGDLETRTAEELRIGELVPIARKIPPANEIHQVDLVEQLTDLLTPREQQLWRVSGERLKEAIKAKRRILIEAATSQGYSYQAVVSWIKSGIIPLGFLGLLEVAPETHPALRIGAGGRRKGGKVAWLPAVLEVDGRLGFFLGLFVADGSATRNVARLDIALSEPGLLEIARNLVESIFGISARVYKDKRARMHIVQINSASLVRILENVFGLPGSADKGKLKVPDIIFNCRAQAARRFIAGLLAGDGHTARRRKFVSIATKSKSLQTQICVLAARLGLAFRMGTNREGTQPLYTVNFVGPQTLGDIGNWECSKEGQQEKIRSWSEELHAGTCDHARYERVPIESGLFTLTKVARTSSEPHVRTGFRLCPVQVKKKIARIRSRALSEIQVRQVGKIERLVDSDLGFVRVMGVEELEAPEYVYCFQLAEGEVPGFFAAEGLVFVHNCFGYLGFNNAKFGRIDAHIAVCAWDRKVLVDAARVAEKRGFKVMHGIVDSLWLKKKGAGEEDYRRLRREIEAETGFNLSFEGIYKWIAFLPSKVNAGVPVLNQYFGAYRKGGLKVRGIEARRHDTPTLFSRCQLEMLELLSKADTAAEARAMVGDCMAVFLRYAWSIIEHRAPIRELVFTRNLSRKPGEFANRSLTSTVADQLVREGVVLHAGESVGYVITDYWSKSAGRRAIAFDLVDDRTVYDAKRYVELLAQACSTVLKPFREDCTPGELVRMVNGEILHLEALI